MIPEWLLPVVDLFTLPRTVIVLGLLCVWIWVRRFRQDTTPRTYRHRRHWPAIDEDADDPREWW